MSRRQPSSPPSRRFGSAASPCGRRPRLRSPLLAFGAAVLGAVVLAVAATGATPEPPARVTVIGDSVADALAYDTAARTALAKGIDLQLEVAACRRVDQASCPYNGVRPENVIELTARLGAQLGSTVVVAVGYNDYEDQYAANIDTALAAFQGAGVTHVLWLTLRAVHHSYLTMNDAIFAAAVSHPELTVVDWNLASLGHPEWYQEDGLHLVGTGAGAMAAVIHAALVQLGIARAAAAPVAAGPPLHIVTVGLPDAVLGQRYSVALKARGGAPAYRWAALRALPSGLRLTAAGRITSKAARRAGIFSLALRVTDSAGATAVGRATLRVRPPREPVSTR